MKKFFRRVIKTFKKLSDARLLTFAENVTTSMAQAVAVFPNPVPSLTSINEVIASYSELIQTSASRDKVQVQLKNKSKYALLLMMGQLADYVNTTTTDSADLAKSGFELNKMPAPVIIKAPHGLLLIDGNNSGEVILKFRRVKGASSYLFQYTADTTLTETSWTSIPATTTAYTFTGLAKGTTYYFRALAVGSNLQLVNSIIVNRVSQ